MESETAEAESISTKLALISYSERRPLLPKYANQATKSVFFFFCEELNSLSLDGFEFGIVKPFFWYKKYTTERFTLRSDFTSNMIFFEKKHCQIFMNNYIQINLLLIKIAFSENMIHFLIIKCLISHL